MTGGMGRTGKTNRDREEFDDCARCTSGNWVGPALSIGLILAVGLCAYATSLQGKFVFDDFAHLVRRGLVAAVIAFQALEIGIPAHLSAALRASKDSGVSFWGRFLGSSPG